MPPILTRKRVLVAASAATTALLGSGVAYAFWTTTGSGTGTASVATSNAVTLHASTTGVLSPGTSATVRFTADNPTSGGLKVGAVHLQSVTADAAHPGCVAADFVMADTLQDLTIPANSAGVALPVPATLAYTNTDVDQSACKGASLTLNLSSN